MPVETNPSVANLGVIADSDSFRRELRARAKKATDFLQRPTTLPNLLMSSAFLLHIERVMPGAYDSKALNLKLQLENIYIQLCFGR